MFTEIQNINTVTDRHFELPDVEGHLNATLAEEPTNLKVFSPIGQAVISEAINLFDLTSGDKTFYFKII
jgi:hypothetical protein